ncbi:MAG: extracellular solute-binding protein, partial [Actinobacteria bacterium]|nr:extracellular solute-binding protein [Actinomycetota bacterium]
MKVSKSAKAFKLLVAGAFALSATIVPISGSFANTPNLGAKCTDEGVNTGTTSRSLICVKNDKGELRWTRVKLSSTGQNPVSASRAPAGSIEFHHWRGEDKTVFDAIIAKFEAANPGVKVTQVIKDSTSYQATALTTIRSNPKAAVFTTFRGGQFNDFFKANMVADITNQRFVKNNVIQSALAPATVGGKVYGIPYQSLFNNPLYNADMFAKKGWKVPKNWTQLLAFCKTAKADGIIPFAWPAATRGNAGQILNSFLMNSAPDLATLEQRVADIESGKADLNSAWFKDMANKYKQMNDAGCFPNNVTG